MDYYAMEPPFELRVFEEMTKKEAQQHFDWFVSQIPYRLSQLKKLYIWSTESNIDPLDLSPESLVALWKWFIPRVEIEPKSPEQLSEELANLPEWMHEIHSKNPSELTLATQSLIIDIGIYYGEVFRKEYPEMEWGFVTKPKKIFYVNRPIVTLKETGFEYDPRHMVYIQSLKVLKNETKNEALLGLFNVEREYIGNLL
ncbi:MAG: hypothetical protein WBF39_08360 [Planococcus donghaensis]